MIHPTAVVDPSVQVPDSCRIGPNEERLLRNTTSEPATLLVVMPYSVTT